MLNIISRRSFLERAVLAGAGLGLASLSNIPLVLRRAMAEGAIGKNGKKLLFIFLRGANDGLNAVVPTLDPTYSGQRSNIYIAREGQASPTDATGGAGNYNTPGAYGSSGGLNLMFDATQYRTLTGTPRSSDDATFVYNSALPGGNGFAGLHPSFKFLAPLFNAGQLAIVHRVGYPFQSRSHFDSQNYWENGVPGAATYKEGIFYRTMLEAIQADPAGVGLQALTGVSFQSQLPLILRGSKAAMTNLADPTRYSLLGVSGAGASAAQQSLHRAMNTNALAAVRSFRFAEKGVNRDVLQLQYENMVGTLGTFASIDFTDTGNNFFDDVATDADADWYSSTAADTKPANVGYRLFPHSNDSNGGWRRPSGATVGARYVVPTNQYGFFRNLKAAALVLGNTNAIIAGTEIGGWDTHNNQVVNGNQTTGSHADLLRTIGWSFYALKKFFSNPAWSPQCSWNDVVVITLTEFGRTSAQNNNLGTDHAEAGVFLVAGGAVKGKFYACNTSGEVYNGQTVNWTPGNGGQNGVMFETAGRYLKRAVDFRSILGEILRKHLGATPNQLNRIIPGYANESAEKLLHGGTVAAPTDSVPTVITGELGLI